jgi:ribosomal protein S18 acetylase RimI-like enzyme
MTEEIRLRHPTESDHPRIAAVLDQWFGGRRVWPIAGRAWFRHFAGTSWLAEEVGTPRGFLIGYRSPGQPDIAVVHLVAVDPGRRRRGIARTMVDAFAIDAVANGASRLEAVAWPDEPLAIAFFRGLGFTPEEGPGAQSLYGVPAFPDYEAKGEDRAVLVRTLPATSPVRTER